MMFRTFLLAEFPLTPAVVIMLAVALVLSLDLASRTTGRRIHSLFAVLLGSILSLAMIRATYALLEPGMREDGFATALIVFLVIVAWRFLFGSWDSKTKAAVLGTFVFWIAVHILARETPEERTAHLLAIVIALIPAMVWCALFLPYHRERMSVVLALFFAGMLSTVPILFYDALVKQDAQLHFFLFRLDPESFSRSARSFVDAQWPELESTGSALMSMLVSFLLVGVIEEASKFWVLKRAGQRFMTSVDDALQMAIIVAIGFAFAENIAKSGYFLSFVREYLLSDDGQDWVGFLGNIAGRSILTSMVHIVSTGVLGYFLGLAVFAGPVLRDLQAKGRRRVFLDYAHRILGVDRKAVFRRNMLTIGFLLSMGLHALSNFLVSLPDALPGNPRTLGDLLGSPPGSPFHLFALLIVPTLAYVVGGFYLLTHLFTRKENMKERGHLLQADTFVSEEARL